MRKTAIAKIKEATATENEARESRPAQLRRDLTLSSGDVIKGGTPLEILERREHSVKVRCLVNSEIEHLELVFEFSLLPEEVEEKESLSFISTSRRRHHDNT